MSTVNLKIKTTQQLELIFAEDSKILQTFPKGAFKNSIYQGSKASKHKNVTFLRSPINQFPNYGTNQWGHFFTVSNSCLLSGIFYPSLKTTRWWGKQKNNFYGFGGVSKHENSKSKYMCRSQWAKWGIYFWGGFKRHENYWRKN